MHRKASHEDSCRDKSVHSIPILRANQIAITALHSHMLGEMPRLYFMHFWANDDAGKLTVALRRAIDQMK